MRTIALTLMAFAAFQSAPAFAWQKKGHRVIAAIADRHRSPEARKGVVASFGSETMAEAANWPDFMRSDPSPFWQKTADPWQFVTVPDAKSYEEVGAPPEGDAVTALRRFSDMIRDPKASLTDKRLALRFIIHIVGDLQQPLHAGSRMIASRGHYTRGRRSITGPAPPKKCCEERPASALNQEAANDGQVSADGRVLALGETEKTDRNDLACYYPHESRLILLWRDFGTLFFRARIS